MQSKSLHCFTCSYSIGQVWVVFQTSLLRKWGSAVLLVPVLVLQQFNLQDGSVKLKSRVESSEDKTFRSSPRDKIQPLNLFVYLPEDERLGCQESQLKISIYRYVFSRKQIQANRKNLTMQLQKLCVLRVRWLVLQFNHETWRQRNAAITRDVWLQCATNLKLY